MSTGAALARAPLADPEVARLLREKFLVSNEPGPFVWNRSETLGLAPLTCRDCHGLGLWRGLRSSTDPCKCTTREICRQLMKEWHRCQGQSFVARCQPEKSTGRQPTRRMWSLPRQEFVADLVALARRTLDAEHFRVWRAWHCEQMEYSDAMDATGLDKGRLFHAVYRIEHLLGRAARELKPYPLFPIADYYYR